MNHELIRKKRLQMQMNQTQLAEKIGVKQTVISSWERGTATPTWRHIVKLSEILDIPISRLTENEAPPYEEPGRYIRQLRRQRKLTQAGLAAQINQSRVYISRWELGYQKPPETVLRRLEEFFALSPGSLIEKYKAAEENSKKHQTSYLEEIESKKTIPILGTVYAGMPIYAEEFREGDIEVPRDLDVDFALRIRGDSMLDAGIGEGDLAFCRTTAHQMPKSGDIVVAIVNGDEATLKFLVRNPTSGEWYLIPGNRNYSPIHFSTLTDIIQSVVSFVLRSSDSVLASGQRWIDALNNIESLGIDQEP